MLRNKKTVVNEKQELLYSEPENEKYIRRDKIFHLKVAPIGIIIGSIGTFTFTYDILHHLWNLNSDDRMYRLPIELIPFYLFSSLFLLIASILILITGIKLQSLRIYTTGIQPPRETYKDVFLSSFINYTDILSIRIDNDNVTIRTTKGTELFPLLNTDLRPRHLYLFLKQFVSNIDYKRRPH